MAKQTLRKYEEAGTKIAKQRYVDLGSKEAQLMKELFTRPEAKIKKIRSLEPEITQKYYYEKKGTQEIAKELKISRSSLKYYMRILGMPTRTHSEVWDAYSPDFGSQPMNQE